MRDDGPNEQSGDVPRGCYRLPLVCPRSMISRIRRSRRYERYTTLALPPVRSATAYGIPAGNRAKWTMHQRAVPQAARHITAINQMSATVRLFTLSVYSAEIQCQGYSIRMETASTCRSCVTLIYCLQVIGGR